MPTTTARPTPPSAEPAADPAGWRPWAGLAARLLLAAVWAWAALAKIGDPAAAVRAVRAYRILPEWLAKAVGYGLPFLELGLAALLGLALLVGGTLRAEATLAVANLGWLVLIAVGGLIVPLSSSPAWLATLGALTPSGALCQGLRDVLQDGTAPSAMSLLVLAAWTVLGWAATVRWFRWL